MSLSREFLDELCARVPASSVIGKSMKLVRAGREYKGCCPFHKEKTPSFYVNDQKGFYHCFGCGAHGDVIRFLMEHENLPFMDAVERVAGLAGMQVPKPTKEDEKKFERQMSLYDLMEAAADWYAHQLHDKKNKKLLDYLVERGLTLDSIKAFKLGFAPDDDELKKHLQKAGYKLDSMLEAGLFKQSERRAGEVYPFFRARIMFPVQDFRGRVCAFGGRVIPESHGGPPDKSAPKYINSPETAIYHKGKMLYGLSRARKQIGDGEAVVVVEGYMDAIAMVQAGFQAVAPLGTALTETQIEELWKIMPEDRRAPILCFDGDSAGRRAAGKSLERVLPILKPDHSVKFAFLPDGHDPDTLIQDEGIMAMKKVLDDAIGLFEMLWLEEAQGRNLSEPEAKAGFRAGLTRRVRQIADMTVQEFFIHEINHKVNEIFFRGTSGGFGSSPARPKHGYGFVRGKPIPPGPHTPYRPTSTKAHAPKASKLLREKTLIAAIIQYPELFDEFGEQLGMVEVPHQDYDNLRQELIRFLSAQQNQQESDRLTLDDQAVKQHLIETGHGKILEALFDRGVMLYGFARPGQDVETVREGWREAYARGQTGIRRTKT
jgi:DNA primase